MRSLKAFLKTLLSPAHRASLRALPGAISDNLSRHVLTPRRLRRRAQARGRLAGGIRVHQVIKQTDYSENKKANLRLAIEKLQGLEIRPGETFSFWRLVGMPSQKRGFVVGRNLIGGELRPDIGGGLCQLSGMIYYGALQAGLTITERHSHSIDLYDEETRYTPLGSDATVSYGYKDLRFRNDLTFPVHLDFELTADSVSLEFKAAFPLPVRRVDFRSEQIPGGKRVETWFQNEDNWQLQHKDFYKDLEQKNT